MAKTPRVFSDASGLRLTFQSPRDWLAKALREAARLEAAEDLQLRADCVANAAMTIGHLADWAFHYAVRRGVWSGELGDFLRAARSASPDTANLTDIGNAMKHFDLERRSGTVGTLEQGRVVFSQAFLFGPFQEPGVGRPPGGKLRYVRTIVDDDEIVGFDSYVDGYIMGGGRAAPLFEVAIRQSCTFWEAALGDMDDGRLPPWLGHS